MHSLTYLVMIVVLLVKIRLILRAKKHRARERKVYLLTICWAITTQGEVIFSKLIYGKNGRLKNFINIFISLQ